MSSRIGEPKKLVIVESPTKAKTIRKFLGKEFVVESCMGHVRDLPQSAKDIPADIKKEKWAHLGVNVDDGFKPVYCVPKNKTKIVKELKDKLKDASELILATDEDREGESISWHLVELLKPKVPTKRMVFHEITKEAILKAVKDSREIDFNLVRAQEARRILDRLVGYTISPLLWKKVAYGLSAGRVQSVAVRLIVEKEIERLKFVKASYWGVIAILSKDGVEFEARLNSLKSKKIATGKDFDPDTGKLTLQRSKDSIVLGETEAKSVASSSKSSQWTVREIEQKPISRKPSPPFITSTLQQESNRKLGLSARETMEVAQKLYENGFITYMRTDSTFLSQQAIAAARDAIKLKFGKEYLPSDPRLYEGKKVKGAQEAHESIRPAGHDFVLPEETGLTGMQFKLYEMIWRRTVACQMKNSEQKQTRVLIECGDGEFSASGLVVEFDGYMRAYQADVDESVDKEEDEGQLPDLKENEQLKAKDVTPKEHETKPPARFTEASLVQTMEKEGIGRPSTYASIISTILNRGYVKKNGPALAPTFTAIVVTQLLQRYLPDYVDPGFTSQMEKSLDDIAEGDKEWVAYLTSVYFGKNGLQSTVARQETEIDTETSRTVTLPGFEELAFKVGRYGAYVCRVNKETGEEVCASIPESMSAGDMTEAKAHQIIDQKIKGADALGVDPISKEKVFVMSGRFGPYVQLGEAVTDDKKKLKRTSVPPHISPETISLEQALDLLSLPKTIGLHPDDKKEVKVGIGRFGPYIVHNGEFRSVPKTEDFLTLPLAKALEIMAQPKKGRGRATVLKELGQHADSKEVIAVLSGKYGPYIKSGNINASLPEGTKVEEFTLAAALELIAEKAGKSGKPSKAAKEPKPAKAKKDVVKKETSFKEKSKSPAKKVGKPPAKSTVQPSLKSMLKSQAKAISKPSMKSAESSKTKTVAIARTVQTSKGSQIKRPAQPAKVVATDTKSKSVKPIISRTVTIKKTAKTDSSR